MPRDVQHLIPAGVRGRRYVSGFTWLYRFWDRDDVLLYVGISTDVTHRAMTHRTRRPWWRFVASADAWLESDADIEQVEYDLIQEQSPLFNVTHAIGSEIPTLEYCARREAWTMVDEILRRLHRDDGPIGDRVRATLGPSPFEIKAATFRAEWARRVATDS